MIPSFLPRLDLHTESRGLTCQELTFAAFLSQLRKSDWAESRDALPFDCTFQAAEERELEEGWELGKRTWYRSYATSMVSITIILHPFYIFIYLSLHRQEGWRTISSRPHLSHLTILPLPRISSRHYTYPHSSWGSLISPSFAQGRPSFQHRRKE